VGAPFAATAATGDDAVVVPLTFEDVMRGAASDVLTVAAELAAGITEGASEATLADVAAKPACLNSTDFKCPRVAIFQSVSPKNALNDVLRKLLLIRNTF
jgi:hypothetical protein